ncbi:MAG: hypothetical protein QOI05_3308 [Bradyrhizobium sp.]|jgi:hypoxanthine phosphoribosyltransferase|nr:hypothetical protein [Bradyrhizobium sp.]
MSKTDLIDTILAYVPATRRLDDEARENLGQLSEQRLSLLAKEVASASAIAKRIMDEDGVSPKAAERAVAKGSKRIKEARALFAEANRRLDERRLRQIPVPIERADLQHGWEVPFAPTAEERSDLPVVRTLSDDFIENSSKKLRAILIECFVDLEERFSSSHSGQFGKFVRRAMEMKFVEQFLRARATSLLLETWDLLLEPRRINPDPEVLTVDASFEAVMKQVRNEIVHRPSIYDPHLLSENDEVVVETRAIDGLALLGSRVIDYQPDLLVSLDGGGQIVGKLLHAQFGDDVGFRHGLVTRVHGWGMSVPQEPRRPPARVIIVDDIARSGNAIGAALNLVRSRYPHAEVRAMVIVGTGAARQKLGDMVLYMPNLALNVSVRVPWKNKSDSAFKRLKDGYLLGEEGETLTVSRDIYDRMVKRYRAALNKE